MDHSSTTESHRLPVNTVVADRYIVDAYLAAGGFATVYRAHHREIGRAVAIKVLEIPDRVHAEESFQQRFVQEARLAARINHPGVVSVFDFGLLDDGRAFIAMDLLEGHDLEQELKKGPMSAARIVPLIADCLDALAEGHHQGIVHKDLKPSNLFLVQPGTPRERLVVLDFGIARSFENNEDSESSRVTRENGFTGTPAYLAPEYIRYQTVTPALDVYQMGLILIEALSGRPAVEAENSMGYLLAHCLNPIVLPKVLVDTELGEICLKATRKEHELRYVDASAFRAALLSVDPQSLRDTLTSAAPTAAVPTAARESAATLQYLSLDSDQLATLASIPSFTIETETIAPQPTRSLVAIAVALCVICVLLVGVVSMLSEPQVDAASAPPEPPPLVEPVVASQPEEPEPVEPPLPTSSPEAAQVARSVARLARGVTIRFDEERTRAEARARARTTRPKPEPSTKKKEPVAERPKASPMLLSP